jgi:hypothetical protein
MGHTAHAILKISRSLDYNAYVTMQVPEKASFCPVFTNGCNGV